MENLTCLTHKQNVFSMFPSSFWLFPSFTFMLILITDLVKSLEHSGRKWVHQPHQPQRDHHHPPVRGLAALRQNSRSKQINTGQDTSGLSWRRTEEWRKKTCHLLTAHTLYAGTAMRLKRWISFTFQKENGSQDLY